ncbi:hypothetical protein K440DRAFT_666540 [Wilcoxina mikolae CBS 423.85]|nr:hypothetical protein K440DRAFT_666540 [Wilcoxina mikolae CBS 423.85]
MRRIHGVRPAHNQSIWRSPKWPGTIHYRLVHVPRNFDIIEEEFNIEKEFNIETKFDIANNRNLLKTMASIIQIIVGAKGLYDAQGHQVQQYGYAAYSFTVIPYLFMSLLNLIAVFCESQYPALYLVNFKYEDTVHDSVRYAKHKAITETIGKDKTVITGEPSSDTKMDIEKHPSSTKVNSDNTDSGNVILGAVGTVRLGSGNANLQKVTSKIFVHIAAFFAVALLFAMPYVVIGRISGFDKGQSTTSQRVWIMLWIVSGYSMAPIQYRFWLLVTVVAVVAMGSASIGGLVTVVKMILQIGVCTKI